MNSFKRHIASLLLVGFLFPQIANAVHYLVVPHGLFEQQENRHLISGPAYEYHSCDYHISGIKFLLPNIEYSGRLNTPEERKELLISQVSRISEEAAFHFLVRGPPRADKNQFRIFNLA